MIGGRAYAGGRCGVWAALGLLVPLVASHPASAQATRLEHTPVEAVRSPLLGRADLMGRVFVDENRNGHWDAGETPLAGIWVLLDDGTMVETDGDGTYLFFRIRPGRRWLRISEETLPGGLASAVAPGWVDVIPAGLTRRDLPAVPNLETVEIGQEEVRGWKLFARKTPLPISVVGNVRDIQALVNGRRVSFKVADLALAGVDRSLLAKVGTTALRFRLRTAGRPLRWRVTVQDATGAVLRTFEGTGPPPETLRFDGRDEAGKALGEGSYAVRLCAEWEAREAACSPYRPFGLFTRRRHPPKVTRPSVKARAEVGGGPAPLDADGSFIVSLPAEREEVTLHLLRDDGREVRSTVRLPRLWLDAPPEEQLVSADDEGAPPSALPVVLEGRTEAGATVQGSEGTVAQDGTHFRLPLRLEPGRRRVEVSARNRAGWSRTVEVVLHLGRESPEGVPVVVRPAVPRLRVRLPAEGSRLATPRIYLEGRTAPGNRVQVGGAPVPVAEDGSFAAVVPLARQDGALEIEVRDGAGHRGTVRRGFAPSPSAGEPGAFADFGPFAQWAPAARFGLRGVARASFVRPGRDRVAVYGHAAVGSLAAARGGAPAAVEASAGAEMPAGADTRLGLHYGGRLGLSLPGTDAAVAPNSMGHRLLLSARQRLGVANLYAEFSAESSGPPDGELPLLAGASIGADLTPARALRVRLLARARTVVAGPGAASPPEGVEAGAALLWTVTPSFSFGLDLRHIEDRRTAHAEAAGEIGAVSLAFELGEVRLLQSTAGWLTAGALTLSSATRVEWQALPALHTALDYQLLTQTEVYRHHYRLEADYDLLPAVPAEAGTRLLNLRLGLVVEATFLRPADTWTPLVQMRLQAAF